MGAGSFGSRSRDVRPEREAGRRGAWIASRHWPRFSAAYRSSFPIRRHQVAVQAKENSANQLVGVMRSEKTKLAVLKPRSLF